MKTKYDLNSLKLLGALFAVVFAVFILGSFKAEAQSVTITGPPEVCGLPAVSAYTANPVGIISPGYTWYWSGSYGDPQGGSSTLQQFSILWNTPTCNAWPRTTSNWAYVYVAVTELAGPPYPVYTSAVYYVDLYNILPIPATITPTFYCQNASSKPITGNAVNCRAVGQWKTDPPGGLIFLNDFNANTTVLGAGISGSYTAGTYTPGVYTLTWNMTNGTVCAPTTVTTTFTIFANPAFTISTNAPVCFGTPVVATVNDLTGVTTPATYTWSTTSGTVVGTPTNTATITGAAVGTQVVTLTITNSTGCATTVTQTFTVNQKPAFTITAPNVCSGANVVATVTGLTGTVTPTYVWLVDGIAPAGSPTNTLTITAPSVGTHTIVVTITNHSSVGSCATTVTQTFTVNALPAVTCPANFARCIDAAPVTLTGGLPTGGVYSGVGVATGVFTPSVAGVGVKTITYTYTDGNTCVNSCTFTITVNPLPVFTIVNSTTFINPPWTNPVLCSGATHTFTLSVTVGTISSVMWYVNGVQQSTSTAYPFVRTVTSPTTFVVRAVMTDTSGCVSEQTVSIVVLPLPVITLNQIVGAMVSLDAIPYTVFCNIVPGGYWMFGNNIAHTAQNQGCDVQYRWYRQDESLPSPSFELFGETGQHLLIGQLTKTYTFKREAQVISCLCGVSPWHSSNEITIYVVPGTYFTAIAGANPAPVCAPGPVTLAATAAPPFSTGLWTGPANITFANAALPNTTATSTEAGAFTLTWTLTPAPYVYPVPCNTGVMQSTIVATFEGIGLAAGTPIFGLPAEVCHNSSPISMVTPTITTLPVGIAVTTAWSGTNVVGNVFTPSTVGTHTITFTASSVSTTCTASVATTIRVNPLPTVVLTTSTVPICAPGVVTVTATLGGGTVPYTVVWRENSVIVATVTTTSTTITRVISALGTTTVTATVTDSKGCATNPVTSNVANILINTKPVVSNITANPSPVFYDDNVVLTATQNINSATNFVWTVVGSKGTVSTSSPTSGTTTSTLTIDSFLIGIGTYTVTVTVTNNATGCVSDPLVRTFTVSPPIHAHFSPSYLVERAQNPVINVPINIPLNIEFFNGLPHTANNINPLPAANIGDFVVFERWNGSSWVLVPFSAALATGNPNRINVTPSAGSLEYGTDYRLGFANVYKQGGLPASNKIVYTHDATGGAFLAYTFNEANNAAFIIDNMVRFTTISLCLATVPTVFPTGTNKGLCDVIKVEFVNPVRYLSGVEMTPSGSGSNPQHKFKLQRLSGSTWVDVGFTAVPSNFSTGLPMNGPKIITLTANTPQLLYCTEYRVIMNPYEPIFGGDPPSVPWTYGFIDLVTSCNVLPLEENGWLWTTTCTYNLGVAVNLNTTGFGTPPWNSVVGSAVVGTVSTTTTTLFTVSVNTPSFTLTATPSQQGYRWTNWQRSLNGGTNWTALPTTTTGIVTPVHAVNWAPNPLTFDPNVQKTNCLESLAFRADFAINEYMVRRSICEGGGGTISSPTSAATGSVVTTTHTHGTTVVFTATPAAGKKFTGWTQVPSGPVVVVGATPDPYATLTPAPGVITITFTGPLTHGTVYNLQACFDEWYPKVWGAAYGTDAIGTVVPNLANIQFTTLWVSNIMGTGRDAASVFAPDGVNEYEWATFRYGNPSPIPPVGVHFAVTVTPLDVPCQYRFVKWERWMPATSTWSSVSTNIIYTFIPTENYRLRAVFAWKTDIMVSVANDVFVVPGTAAEGSILIQQGTSSWYNSPGPRGFKPGDMLTLTVFPEPRYMTYGWVTPAGVQIPNYNPANAAVGGIVSSPLRYEDRTVWQYVVGCSPVDLRAVIGLKRFRAFAEATPVGPPRGGDVRNSLPPQVATSVYGYGFWPEDVALGFADHLTLPQTSGYFDLDTPVSFIAVASVNTVTQTWVFDGWYEGSTSVSTLLTYPRNIVATLNLQARFINTYTPPTWAVTITSAPADAALTLTGAGFFAAATTRSVQATPKVGWDFKSWTATGITLPVGAATNPLSFTMPTNAVALTANFEKTKYNLSLVPRTYLRNNTVTSWPYTTCQYIIGELLPAAVTGGVVTDLTGTVTYVFGDVVSLRATPHPGFRLVNWMVGSILSESSCNQILRGSQINPFSGVTVYPGTMTFNYTIPAVAGTPQVIYAVFAEATAPVYPVQSLTTTQVPLGYGVTTGDGHFAHGVDAVVTQMPTRPGYEFWYWSANVATAGSVNYVRMTNNYNSVATAYYRPINYRLCVEAVNGYGRVSIDGGVFASSAATYYTIEDTPIYISAIPGPGNNGGENGGDDCYNYTFTGWSYDYLGTRPVVYTGTDPMFGFIPVVPEAYMSDGQGCDVTIYAQFSRVPIQYTLTLQTALNSYTNINTAVGTVSTNVGGPYWCTGIPYPMVISTTANTGYRFLHYTNAAGTVIVTIPTFNFDLTDNSHFIAVYEKIPFTITVTADPTAGGTVSGGGTYRIGESVTLTATLYAGYTFNGWFEGAALISSNLVHTISPLGFGARAFTARYTLNRYTLTVNVTGPGTVTVNQGTTTLTPPYTNINHGTVLTLTAAPGGIFTGWSGGLTGTTNPATLTLVANTTVTGTFSACAAVTNLAAGGITAKQSSISWTAAAGAISYDLRYKLSTTGTWGAWAAATTPKVLTGLTPNATYNVEVRTVCGTSVFATAVSTTFTTRKLGDVNCDGVTNTLDIITLINYIMNTPPVGGFTQCTIDGADINGDGFVNVLDVVALVNLTMGGAKSAATMSGADMYLGSNMITFSSEGNVAALQFELKGANVADTKLQLNLEGFDLVYRVDGYTLMGLVFSTNNQPIPAGMVDLISISGNAQMSWGDLFGGNLDAKRIPVNGHGAVTGEFTLSVFPNPTRDQMFVNFSVPSESKVNIRLLDLTGRVTAELTNAVYSKAEHKLEWNNTRNLKPGLYILQMTATPESGKLFRNEVKVVIIK